ncbi:MAG: folate-binding protein [Limnohabitans sp.]|nr:folate-binding protein [Limnohabitans sp.]
MQDFIFNGQTPLPHLGVIKAQGVDAAHFLHNQLTQDFLLIQDGEARLAAFCNAKGRMQASFLGIKKSAEEILLICDLSLLAQTLKHLSMFVLRSKVKLTDASQEFSISGCIGKTASDLMHDASHWRHQFLESTDLISLYPSLGYSRVLCIAPFGALPSGPPIDVDAWRWAEVHSGVVMLDVACLEAFVPQMLNYESVGGVNFKKGCYPGQEVVARSQFRGTLKRRAFIVHGSSPFQSGQEIFSSQDPLQPCGMVVQAASWRNQFAAIVSLQTQATLKGALHLGSSQGDALQLQDLPYPLLEDI